MSKSYFGLVGWFPHQRCKEDDTCKEDDILSLRQIVHHGLKKHTRNFNHVSSTLIEIKFSKILLKKFFFNAPVNFKVKI